MDLFCNHVYGQYVDEETPFGARLRAMLDASGSEAMKELLECPPPEFDGQIREYLAAKYPEMIPPSAPHLCINYTGKEHIGNFNVNENAFIVGIGMYHWYDKPPVPDVHSSFADYCDHFAWVEST